MTRATPPVVLGVCAFTTDSAAALIVDGSLVGFAQEERLTGVPHTNAYPTAAVTLLLDDARLTPDQVDVVAYPLDGDRFLTASAPGTEEPPDPGNAPDRDGIRARGLYRAYLDHQRRITDLNERFRDVRVVLHHQAHAMNAYVSSGYDEAAVLVVDHAGEVQTTTIGHARRTATGGCRYRIRAQLTDPHSIADAYTAVTRHLGWQRGDEQNLMRLAGTGNPARFRAMMHRAIAITKTGFELNQLWFPVPSPPGPCVVSDIFAVHLCGPRDPDGPTRQVHADLAAALQERTEEVMVHLARRARQITQARHLCVGGALAANSVAIKAIVATGLFDDVHVPPSPGEAGTAIGAATAVHLDLTRALPRTSANPRRPGRDNARRPRPPAPRVPTDAAGSGDARD
ncbi:MAG TPA: carbamoyltransferase N-terminal domain-containing protein [Micromonosporaceae bacterium]|nr:carbamoyltransferase N-terminal domain-containing protein [Micromonosporaceae bacterium]